MDVSEINQIELKLLKLEYLRQQYNRNSRKYYWNKVVRPALGAQKQKIAANQQEPTQQATSPEKIPTVEIRA